MFAYLLTLSVLAKPITGGLVSQSYEYSAVQFNPIAYSRNMALARVMPPLANVSMQLPGGGK